MKIPKFLKDLLQDLAKDYIKWILLFILGGGLIVFFKKIIVFLNLSLNLPIWVFIACLLLISLIVYGISKPKPKKKEVITSFKDYGNFSWKVTTYPDGDIFVDINPHCLECHAEYLISGNQFYGEEILTCPKPGCKNFNKQINHPSHAINTLNSAVQKVVEAETRNYSKK